MNRLTTDSNIWDVVNDDTFAFQCFLRLKAYEDTGLSPEDVIKIKKYNERRMQLLCNAVGLEVNNMDEQQKREPDNIDCCVKAAKELSERKGKYITYGMYMAVYYNKKPKAKRKAKK